eukprot:8150774-Alexandrium_andersonii.AAC.1
MEGCFCLSTAGDKRFRLFEAMWSRSGQFPAAPPIGGCSLPGLPRWRPLRPAGAVRIGVGAAA